MNRKCYAQQNPPRTLAQCGRGGKAKSPQGFKDNQALTDSERRL